MIVVVAAAAQSSSSPSPPSSDSPCADSAAFSEIAEEVGISFVHDRGGRGTKEMPETMGSGLAWIDFDGDGRQDLYVVQSGPFPEDPSQAGTAAHADRLFRNLGGGRFEEVRGAVGPGGRSYGQGAVAADFDGDGHLDLYLANWGPDRLLRNRGDGTFEDATATAGLGLGAWSSSAALADFDGDGDLDLYVTRYVRYASDHGLYCGDLEAGRLEYCDPALFDGESDRLFRNRGDGTFEDVTAAAGLEAAAGKGLAVVFTDLTGDDRPDVYVANDLTLNLFFENRGDGTFEDQSLLSGTAVNREGKVEAGMGLTVGDVDYDGDPDLMVTNFDVETNTLYRNLGAGFFEDVSASSGFGVPSFNTLAFGLSSADFDLDGDLDVYVSNGHIFEEPRRESVFYAQPDLLLLGDGAGRFTPHPCPTPGLPALVGRGSAVADFDDDGDPDLAQQNSGGPLRLLRNESAGSWLGVTLRGAGTNRWAVGARVELESRGRRQLRWVQAGGSFASSDDPRVLFALPPGEEPLRLHVRWPSGRRTVIEQPPTGTYLQLAEPSAP